MLALFLAFFRIGLFTFGGGFAMLPFIEREVVERKGWLSREELTDCLALVQTIPGPVAVNTAIMVGRRMAGKVGVLLATVGVVLPPFVVILVIASSYGHLQNNLWVNAFFAGVRPVVVGLIAASAIKLGRSILHSWSSWLIFSLVLLALVIGGVNPVWVIMGAAILGWGFARLE